MMSKSEISIFPMKFDDIPDCVRVLMENDLWRQYGITAQGAVQLFEKALENGANIIVAKKDNRTAGFAWCTPRGAFDRSAYLRLIGVLPEYQQAGIGKHLLHAVEEMAAKETGDLFLLVTATNAAAQKFYLREGYSQIGAIPDYVIDGITELIFHKRLIK